MLILVDAVTDVGASGGVDGPPAPSTSTVRAAAALAAHHIRVGDRVCLRVLGRTGQVLGPGSGTVHQRRLQELLAQVQPGWPEASHAARRLRLRDRRPAASSWCSPVADPGHTTAMVSLARRGLERRLHRHPRRGHPARHRPRPGVAGALAWRLRLLEREIQLTEVSRRGIPVVPGGVRARSTTRCCGDSPNDPGCHGRCRDEQPPGRAPPVYPGLDQAALRCWSSPASWPRSSRPPARQEPGPTSGSAVAVGLAPSVLPPGVVGRRGTLGGAAYVWAMVAHRLSPLVLVAAAGMVLDAPGRARRGPGTGTMLRVDPGQSGCAATAIGVALWLARGRDRVGRSPWPPCGGRRPARRHRPDAALGMAVAAVGLFRRRR